MSNGAIVVVGGGFVGFSALRQLEKRAKGADIVVVEPREYTEIPFAVLRGLTDPSGLGRTMRKPWTEITQATHVAAKALEISGNEVVLEGGERLPFAQAIVATGSTTKGYPFFKGGTAPTIAAREQQFMVENEKLRAATSVLIIGGGPIGVELAGEIGAAYPDKQLQLVQRAERLLPALPGKAGDKALRVLTRLGVEVALGVTLKQQDGHYTDGSGRTFTADLVYAAIGIRTDAIPVDGPASINDKGQLRVDAHLRVRGRQNVFAVGDVNDVPEIKLGATGRMQGNVAVRNIVALRQDPSSKLKTYKPAKPMALVTLGPNAGLTQLPFGRFDLLTAMKQKDFFISMYLGK